MEKNPNKNTNSSASQSEWEDFARRVKAYREAKNANKADLKQDRQKELEQDHQKEFEQDKQKELEQDRQRELARANELEIKNNTRELEDRYEELLKLNAQKEMRQLEEDGQNSQAIVGEQENKNETQELENKYQELLDLDIQKEIQKLEEKHEELLKLSQPLIAISADWTHDKKAMAHDLAEQTLNAEVSEAKGIRGAIKRIWKGNLFKKYYEKKYEKEFLSNERTNKEGKTLRELIREESPAVMERFVMSAVEQEEGYIHGLAGEKFEKVDEKTNAEIKAAIEKYARTSLEKGEKVSDDLNCRFLNDMGRIMENAIKEHREGAEKGYKRTNYLEVAKEAARRYEEIAISAKTKAEHDKAMAEVMAGFQAYHAEVRNNVRTEAHRDNLDKIVNWFESNPIGRFVPAEIVAGAAGAAMALTQTGVKAIFGAVGGIVASSAIAGLRERNRVTEDRARMLRDIASGKDYASKNKKVAKHEVRIGGTLYDMRKASDLTDRLNSAMYPEDGKINQRDLLSAIAEARVRIDFSDSESKDLIAYSSDQDRGKERLELDIAVIRAEKSLSQEEQKLLEKMKENILEDVNQSVSEKDRKFKNYRTAAALKKAGKTLALGSAIFLGSQEIMAAIDPAKIGIFEKAGLIKTENANNAKETLLASGFGQFRGSYEAPGASNSITTSTSDPKIIKKLEADGYKRLMMTKKAWSENIQDIKSVDPSASTAKVDVKYDGWASKGGLSTNLENGKFVSTIRGAATIDGRSINYTPDQLKAFITIGDSKFEIAGTVDGSGRLTWGEGGVFTTTSGDTIKAIGDNGEKLYKYFEIAADNGPDANGIQHIVPLATDVGANTFSGKIDQLIETSTDHPAVYSFVKEIPGNPETIVRGISTNGFAFAPPALNRAGLGEAIAPAPDASVERENPSAREALESVPEENIEVMPNAPVEVDANFEATPEEPTLQSPVNLPPVEAAPSPAPESDSTPESGFATWENQIQDEIEDARTLIGDEGVSFITDPEQYYGIGSEKDDSLNAWWNGLSNEGKARVNELVNDIESSNYKNRLKWGSGFLTWHAVHT